MARSPFPAAGRCLGERDMNADDFKVEAVLKEDRRFIVPLYQRKYRWAEDRLLLFWEDVQAKAAEVLAGESRFEHYMGALIVAPVDIGSQISRTPVVQVVDGQQRLTTFQLFLVALREVARRHGLGDFISHINGYLFNNPKSKDTDLLTRFKLTPTPSDRELFHSLIEMGVCEPILGRECPKKYAVSCISRLRTFQQVDRGICPLWPKRRVAIVGWRRC